MCSVPSTRSLPTVCATANHRETWCNASVVSNGIISCVSSLTAVSRTLLSSAVSATPSTISKKKLLTKYMEDAVTTISVRRRCL